MGLLKDGKKEEKATKVPVNPSTDRLATSSNLSTHEIFSHAADSLEKPNYRKIGFIPNSYGAVGVAVDHGRSKKRRTRT